MSIGDHPARCAVDEVPFLSMRLSVRREIDAIALGCEYAVAIGFNRDEHVAAGVHVLVGHDTATLAVDVVPLGERCLTVRHQIDALLPGRVDTAVISRVDNRGVGVEIQSEAMFVGDYAARLTVHIVPMGLIRLHIWHEVDALADRTIDATLVGALSDRQRLRDGVVGDHLVRATVDVVPIGLASLVVGHQVDAHRVRTVDGVAVCLLPGDWRTGKGFNAPREQIDVVPLAGEHLVVGYEIDATLEGRVDATAEGVKAQVEFSGE